MKHTLAQASNTLAQDNQNPLHCTQVKVFIVAKKFKRSEAIAIAARYPELVSFLRIVAKKFKRLPRVQKLTTLSLFTIVKDSHPFKK